MKQKDIPLKTKRFYKVKNPKKNFLCALCSAPRSMKYSKQLGAMNYLQIILISSALTLSLFNIIGPKVIFSVFVVWAVFEIVNKLLYRKEIPCPYCGFDATWYRRDVKKANQLVKEFWAKNYPELVSPKLDETILDESQNIPPEQLETAEAPSQTAVN
ncbi:MAG: hypothetical protein CME62_14665 [Halobacteriovoraceae bacterium]|nr:hypothetical protein [Halobacteriovoraceae bacterium]|tara:strand:+ start:1026 stop:1499 length:474 start_codon:yes stop_codon:yes gene_type:complete